MSARIAFEAMWLVPRLRRQAAAALRRAAAARDAISHADANSESQALS
jgi:hypothetical protein